MKKVFLLLSTLLFTISGVRATEVSTVSTAGTPLSLAQLKALSGTGGHVAFANLGSGGWTNKWLANPSNNSDLTLSKVQLYTITDGSVSGKFYMQCVNDNLYRTNGGWGDLNDAENIEFRDYTGGISISCDNPISIHNNSGTQWNINYGSFGGALNGWAAYAAYGPFYILEVNCIDDANGGATLQTSTQIVTNGHTMDIPAFNGKQLVGGSPASIVINGADAVYNLHYVASTFDYDIVITGDIPTGTVITVKGDAVVDGDHISYGTEVEGSDVVVTYPAGYEYMTHSATISGTTITIKCYDSRWPVNFDKETLRSTHTSRYTDKIGLNDQSISFAGAVGDLIYRDLTNQSFVLPVGATVTPLIGFRGWAMYGYLYIDYNNDGDFTDEGELVSQLAGNTWPGNTSDKTIPDFTLTTTPGTYRARFKVEWDNTNPGGGSQIAEHGGCIIDVMIEVKDAFSITYNVVDGNNNILGTLTQDAPAGSVITSFPASMYKTLFYTYSAVPETTVDDNKTITITATLKDDAPVRFTADASDPYYYNLKIRSKFIVRQNDNSVRNQTESEPFNSAASWAFIGNPYAGFRVINKAAGTNYYLMYDEIRIERHAVECVTLRENDTRTWIVDTNNGGFVLRATENPNVYLHQRTDNGLSTCSVTEWSSVHNDEGSTIEASTDEDILFALYNNMKDMTFGAGLGEYSTTYVGTDGAAADIVSIGAIISGEVTSQYPTAYSTLVDINTNSTLNMPTTGFYRIKGKTSGNYLAAGMDESTNRFKMSNAEDATTIFYFDGTKLTNFKTGMCNGMTSSAWEWVTGENASTVVFQDGLTAGGYGIKSATCNFSDEGTTANRYNGLTIDANTDAKYTNWQLTEITTLPVSISSVGYATLYSPVALTIPANVAVYTASDEGAYLRLNDIAGQSIPANTGVILAGDAGIYDFTITDDNNSMSNNALTGTVAAIARPTNSYILATGSSGVGFYKDGASTIPGFKAYLPASSGETTVKAFRFDDEDSIKSLFEAQENAEIYNLAGQRISKLQKGVNIINGKKVVIK